MLDFPLFVHQGSNPCHYWVLSRHNVQWLKILSLYISSRFCLKICCAFFTLSLNVKRGLNCQNIQGVRSLLCLGDALELCWDAPLVEELGHGRLSADAAHLGHAGDLVKLKS